MQLIAWTAINGCLQSVVCTRLVAKVAFSSKSSVYPAYTLIVSVTFGLWSTIDGANGFVSATNFHARNHGALISLPLALVSFAFALNLFCSDLLKQSFLKLLISILSVGVLSWHVVGIGLWNDYLASFRIMLESKLGLLTWDQAKKQLSPAESMNLAFFQWTWTAPTMSYLLSKEGKVKTIITNPGTLGWQPFNPLSLSKLPRNEFFDPSPYIQALGSEAGTILIELRTDSVSLVHLSFEDTGPSDMITLIVPEPTSPLEYSGGLDTRLLGIALKNIKIELPKNAKTSKIDEHWCYGQ